MSTLLKALFKFCMYHKIFIFVCIYIYIYIYIYIDLKYSLGLFCVISTMAVKEIMLKKQIFVPWKMHSSSLVCVYEHTLCGEKVSRPEF